jgi:hypothetical protein
MTNPTLPPLRFLRAFTFLAFSIVTAFLWSGCDTEKEPLPAYLKIAPFQLTVTSTQHGSVSHKITNASVTLLDDEANAAYRIGVLPLPADVPVLSKGELTIQIDPVIRTNGSSQFLNIYPFYSRFTKTINLVEQQTTEVQPVSSYIPEAKFEFIEDFEGSTQLFTLEKDGNVKTAIVVAEEVVFEGNASGHIYLDTANSLIAVATNQVFEIEATTAARVFLEVNFKTEVIIEFAVITVDNSGLETPNFEFGVLPSDEWNKIYFDVTELISNSMETKFRFGIRAELPIENGKFTLNEADIYLDNIKVVHF